MTLAGLLRGLPAFAEFTDEELSVLEHAMSSDRYADGHVFVREGAQSGSADAMYVILDGTVRITRSGDARAFEKRLGRGEMFGLVALVDPGIRSASCIADGPVTAASLYRAAFDMLFHSHTAIACKFQFAVARQLARDHQDVYHRLLDALESGDRSRVLDQ